METAFVTAGLVCLMAAAIGGGLKAFGMEIPVVSSVGRQLTLAVLGVGLIVAGLWIGFDETNGTTTTTATIQTTTTAIATTSVIDSTTSATTGATAPTDTTTPPGCFVDVTHFAAEIKEEPDHRSRTLSSVPEGRYFPIGVTETVFAGRTEQWFQIEVDGRTGWIVDEPILLSKSSDCP